MARKSCRWCAGGAVDLEAHEANCLFKPEDLATVNAMKFAVRAASMEEALRQIVDLPDPTALGVARAIASHALFQHMRSPQSDASAEVKRG